MLKKTCTDPWDHTLTAASFSFGLFTRAGEKTVGHNTE